MLGKYIVSLIPGDSNEGDEDARLLEAGIDLNRQAVAIHNVNDREHSRRRDRRPEIVKKWNTEDACRFRAAGSYSWQRIGQVVLHCRVSAWTSMLTLGHS